MNLSKLSKTTLLKLVSIDDGVVSRVELADPRWPACEACLDTAEFLVRPDASEDRVGLCAVGYCRMCLEEAVDTDPSSWFLPFQSVTAVRK